MTQENNDHYKEKIHELLKKIESAHDDILNLTADDFEILNLAPDQFKKLFYLLNIKVFTLETKWELTPLQFSLEDKILKEFTLCRYQTPNGKATLLGHPVNEMCLWFYLDNQKNASYWRSIENIQDMKANSQSFYPIDNRIEGEDQKIVHEALSSILEKNKINYELILEIIKDTIQEKNRPKLSAILEWLLELDEKTQQTSTAFFSILIRLELIVTRENIKSFKLIGQYLGYLKKHLVTSKQAELEWRAGLKKCLFNAIGAKNLTAVKILTREENQPFIMSGDLSDSEMQQLIHATKDTPSFLKYFLIIGWIREKHLPQYNGENLVTGLIKCAKLFYEGINSEEIFLQNSYIFEACHINLQLTLKLIASYVRTIHSYAREVDLSNLKVLLPILKLSISKDNNKNDHRLLSTIIAFLLTVDFDNIPNRSLFKNNSEKIEFIRNNFIHYVPSLELMTNPNNNIIRISEETDSKNNNTTDMAYSESEDKIYFKAELDVLLLKDYEAALARSKINEVPPSFYSKMHLNILILTAQHAPSKAKTKICALLGEGYTNSEQANPELAFSYFLQAIILGCETSAEKLCQLSMQKENSKALCMIAKQIGENPLILHDILIEKSNIFTEDSLDFVEIVAKQQLEKIPQLALYLIFIYASKKSIYYNPDKACEWLSLSMGQNTHIDHEKLFVTMNHLLSIDSSVPKEFSLNLLNMIREKKPAFNTAISKKIGENTFQTSLFGKIWQNFYEKNNDLGIQIQYVKGQLLFGINYRNRPKINSTSSDARGQFIKNLRSLQEELKNQITQIDALMDITGINDSSPNNHSKSFIISRNKLVNEKMHVNTLEVTLSKERNPKNLKDFLKDFCVSHKIDDSSELNKLINHFMGHDEISDPSFSGSDYQF